MFKLLIFIFIFGLGSVASAEVSNYSADIRYLHVQKGQTLHNIVKRLYPSRVREWPKISNEIVRINPHAFVNSDPTQMKAGVRLKLPQRAVIRSTPVKAQKKVGIVAQSEGSVVAVNARKVSRKLSRGQPVFLGDKVITGENGFVRLKMIDDAVLDLRCFSIMVIEEYALSNTSRRSILNLLQGSLKKVTGQIGKMTDDVYQLKTPVASVGVRGTEYALRVFQAKGCGGMIDADDGLYLEVIKGLVDVHNEAGSEVITKGETAYVPLPNALPEKAKFKAGIVKPVAEKVDEGSGGLWWWLLGIVAVVLLI